jgi:replication-associated recombination protein RarA
MLPRREFLDRLVKSNTSFVLYGQKASGKTKLVRDLFKEKDIDFIEINCTLVSKKTNFLRLFNVELNKFIREKGI